MTLSGFFSTLFAPFTRNFWVSRWDDTKHFLSQLINFEISALTGTRSYLFGLLPTFSTLIMLLLSAAVLSIVPWAVASLTATTGLGASVGIAQGASAYLYSFIGVMAYAIGSYWFEGPLSRALYKGTPASPGAHYGHDQSVDLHKLVRHSHHLLLASEYFYNLPEEEKLRALARNTAFVIDQKKLGAYCPFSVTINKSENKKHLINGTGRDETAGHLNFSSGCFSSELRLDFNERAALTMMAIAKVRQRKTLRTAIFAMCQNVLGTIEALQQVSGLFKVFLPITNIIKLLGRASERTAYKECLIEVTKAGMGEALKSGLKKAACFSLDKKEKTGSDVRPEYIGGHWYDFIKKPLYNHLRKIEGSEYKQHWFLALVDNLVMNLSYFISRLEATELNSEEIGNIIAETIDANNLNKLHFSLTGQVEKRAADDTVTRDNVAYPAVEKSIKAAFAKNTQSLIVDYYKPESVIRLAALAANNVENGGAQNDEAAPSSNRLSPSI